VSQGDIVAFNAGVLAALNGTIDLEADTFKFGLITSSLTPSASTAGPCWGAGGSTNLTTYQVTPGGNYATGGPAIANTAMTESSGTVKFDGDDITIAQDASNPTTARWGIIYSDTAANKNAFAYVDLGGITDLSAGAFTATLPAAGIWYTNVAA
jgi:hypothetical protein